MQTDQTEEKVGHLQKDWIETPAIAGKYEAVTAQGGVTTSPNLPLGTAVAPKGEAASYVASITSRRSLLQAGGGGEEPASS